jgi:poly-gamma-glutamate capsule biosynthesis protein CapA/YwtB (metallophosphatase superfamily)
MLGAALLGLALLASAPDAAVRHPSDEREAPPLSSDPLVISAVGDVNLGRAWPTGQESLPSDPARLFDGMKRVLGRPDILLGNLETVLADSGESTKCRPESTQCFAFRVPTSFAKHLKGAGFGALSIANNHAGDFGMEGRKETMAALDSAGIRHSGPLGDIASWQVKGKKVAMVGFSFGSDVYRIQEIEAGRALMEQLQKDHDLVIVFFHAGAEGRGADHVKPGTERFLGEDRGDSIAFAHAMIESGADLALGSGPHLLRGMELYQGRLIAYSLGNFCAWETFGLAAPNNLTGVLEVALAPNGVATEIHLVPGIIEKPGRPVPDPERRAIERVRELSLADFGNELLDAEGHWSLQRAQP